MSKRRKRSTALARAEPKRTRSIAFVGQDAWDSLECAGYTSLASNPEICTAVDTIARLVASMTIHLMENTDKGDIRIKNELSRKVDINPQTWVHWLVKTMMLQGNGNAVVWPDVRGGILHNLNPIPPAFASFIPDGIWDYKILIAGQEYSPDEVLHFVLNPSDVHPWMGTGYRVALADVANNLKQAAATEKGFMASKWKPSIIVKVDALVDEFSSPEGRRRLLESYASSGEAGEPGLIQLAQYFRVPYRLFTPAELERVSGEFPESEFVRRTVGTGNVCHRAAAAAAGGGRVRRGTLADTGGAVQCGAGEAADPVGSGAG